MNAILVYLLGESSADLDSWLSNIYVGNDPSRNLITWTQTTILQSWFGVNWSIFVWTVPLKLAGWFAISTWLARNNIFWKM